MLRKIKNNIEKELKKHIEQANKKHKLSTLSPILYENLKDFILRKGKRIRPTLLVLGYLGFCKKRAKKLYSTAISVELLHDFMLIHDDIIDKSNTRRGKPSMHKMLISHLQKHRELKFSGEDLSIVIGDVLYALAIETFLSIKENPVRKEKALRKFIQAAMYTGSGEFIELLAGTKSISDISKKEIYNIYDYKTAFYTFACPLSAGAILGGAENKEIKILSDFGILSGRAFQIKDDMLGIFGNEKKTGKPTLTDLQEAKRTLPLWHAYKKSINTDKSKIKRILKKTKVTSSDLSAITSILEKTNTKSYANKQINNLIHKAQYLLERSRLKTKYKNLLSNYISTIFQSS